MWIINKLRDERGELLPKGDADQLTDEERAQLEAEARGEGVPPTQEEEAAAAAEAAAQAEAERKRLEEEAAKQAAQPPQLSPEEKERSKLTRELQRAQERERRLKESNEKNQQELAALRQEQVAWRARQQLEEEAQKRLAETARHATRPDPEIDPIGAELWDLKEFRRQQEDKERQREAEQERYRLQQEQFQREQALEQDTLNYLRQEREEFLENTPDYDTVTTPVFQGLHKLYQQVGWNEQNAAYLTNKTVQAIALSAKQNGKSAHAAMYAFAKEMRSNPQQMAAVVAAGAAGAAQNGDQAPKTTAAEKIAAINKAQKLSGLGGKTPSENGNLDQEAILSATAEDISNWSDDKYIKIKQDPVLGPLLEARLSELG